MDQARLLIIDSQSDIGFLLPALAGLKSGERDPLLLCRRPGCRARAGEKGLAARRFRLLPQKPWLQALFLLGYPLSFFYSLLVLGYCKYGLKAKTLLLIDRFDRSWLAPGARLLGLRVFGLELPGIDYRKVSRPALFASRLASRCCPVLVLSSHTRDRLWEQGFRPELIKPVRPGLDSRHYRRQETIFGRLAETGHQERQKKYFSLGTVVDFGRENDLESLFRGVRTTLEIIPNLQLVIIGRGREINQYKWLAQKMNIGDLVWFVGEQKTNRWLSNLDIYVVSGSSLALPDIDHAMRAMALGLPVVGPQNSGLEDLILDRAAGFLVPASSGEALSRALIELYRDKRLRQKIKDQAAKRIKQDFRLETMVEDMMNILDNK